LGLSFFIFRGWVMGLEEGGLGTAKVKNMRGHVF
jgi:hypothetical protein